MFTLFFRMVLFLYGRALPQGKLIALMFCISFSASSMQAKETITILMFGDSLTHGYGLPESDGLVPQMQAWLNENGAGHAVLINAGVSGDTTAGGLARIDWMLDDTINAVVVELGGNDLLRGIFPDESRRNLDGILTAISAKDLPTLLIGLPAPANYGPEFKTAFDSMFTDLASEHHITLYPFYMEGFGVGPDTVAMLPFLQADATHPNAEGVGKIVAHLGPVILQLIDGL